MPKNNIEQIQEVSLYQKIYASFFALKYNEWKILQI